MQRTRLLYLIIFVAVFFLAASGVLISRYGTIARFKKVNLDLISIEQSLILEK